MCRCPRKTASATTATPVGPDPVTGLAVTVRIGNVTTGATRVNFTWTASPGATAYRVDRGTGAAPVTVTTAYYGFTGFGDDLSHTATVVAIGPTGESPTASIAYVYNFYDPVDPGCVPTRPGNKCIPP